MSFGKKVDEKKVLEKKNDDGTSTGSRKSDRVSYRLDNGKHAFWMMPVHPDSTRNSPIKSVNMHYNPVHVCGRAPTSISTENGQTTFDKDRDFDNCIRCSQAWKLYGKRGATKEEWRGTERYDKFRSEMSSEKVVLHVVPMNPFVKWKTVQYGTTTDYEMVIDDECQKRFNRFQKQYPEFVASEEYEEAQGKFENHIPGFKFPVKEGDEVVEHITGQQLTLFSFPYWYERGPKVENDLQRFIAKKIAPWDLRGGNHVPALMIINRTQSDPEDFTTVNYEVEFVQLDEEQRLEFSKEFANFMGQNLVNTDDYYNPIEDQDKIREIMRGSSPGSVKETLPLEESPKCFGDDRVYDTIENEKCIECPYEPQCAAYLDKHTEPYWSDEERDEVPKDTSPVGGFSDDEIPFGDEFDSGGEEQEEQASQEPQGFAVTEGVEEPETQEDLDGDYEDPLNSDVEIEDDDFIV